MVPWAIDIEIAAHGLASLAADQEVEVEDRRKIAKALPAPGGGE